MKPNLIRKLQFYLPQKYIQTQRLRSDKITTQNLPNYSTQMNSLKYFNKIIFSESAKQNLL